MFFKKKSAPKKKSTFSNETPEIMVTKITTFDSDNKVKIRYGTLLKYSSFYIGLSSVNSEKEVAEQVYDHFVRTGQENEVSYTFYLYEKIGWKVEARKSITEQESLRIKESLEKLLKKDE